LKSKERAILKTLYFDATDYEKVILTNEHIFSKILKKYSTVVFDNTIVFTNKSYKDDFSADIKSSALLVHEVCCVRQYQNLNYRRYKAGNEHLKFGKST